MALCSPKKLTKREQKAAKSERYRLFYQEYLAREKKWRDELGEAWRCRKSRHTR